MSTQDPLFHDDFNDALANAVKALGRGKIEPVALQLWPAKPRAGQYLADCLNPDRDAKLSIAEIVQLLKWCRAKGIHWAVAALCEEIGYTQPDIKAKLTDRQKRAREAQELANRLMVIADEEAAEQRQNFKAVS